MAEKKKSWFIRHKILTGIGIFIVLGIIVSAAGGNKGATTSTGTTAAASTAPTPDQKTTFAVGEKATFDDKSITLTSIQRNYDTGNQFSQPESSKEFVLVNVEIDNNGSDSMDYNSYEFKMQDSNGVQLNEAPTALSDGQLDSGSLAAGGKVTGKMVFEVPKGDAGLKLLYQSFSFFSNKTITFNLQ